MRGREGKKERERRIECEEEKGRMRWREGYNVRRRRQK